MPTFLPHPYPTDLDRWRIPLGELEAGGTGFWDMRLTPHLLVVGGTGGGKTVLLSGVVCEAAARDFLIYLIDGKGTKLAGFAGWPQVVMCGFADPAAMSATLLAAERLMRERYRQVLQDNAEPEDFQPVLVVLDEAAEFELLVSRWWAQTRGQRDPKVAPAIDARGSLARLMRECGMYFALGLQQAAAGFFSGTEARDNFGARAACGPIKAQAAEMAFGSRAVGLDVPTSIKGRTTVDLGHGPQELQSYWTPQPRPNGEVREEDLPILAPFMPPARPAGPVNEPDPEPDPQLELRHPHKLVFGDHVLMDGERVTVLASTHDLGVSDEVVLEVRGADGQPRDEVVDCNERLPVVP